jgi:hypothetical protein
MFFLLLLLYFYMLILNKNYIHKVKRLNNLFSNCYNKIIIKRKIAHIVCDIHDSLKLITYKFKVVARGAPIIAV